MANGNNLVCASELDRRVQLQAPVPAASAPSDQNAEPGDPWYTVAELWAGIRPLSGREVLLARQVVAEASHEVRIRYRGDVTSRHRFVYKGRLLYIKEPPREIGRQQGLVMLVGDEEAR